MISENSKLNTKISKIIMGKKVFGYAPNFHGDPILSKRAYQEVAKDGYHMYPIELDDCSCSHYDKSEYKDEEFDIKRFGHYSACFEFVPNYSSDMNDVWSLVYKMKELGWELKKEISGWHFAGEIKGPIVKPDIPTDEELENFARFRYLENPRIKNEAKAICLAALESLSIEKGIK